MARFVALSGRNITLASILQAIGVILVALALLAARSVAAQESVATVGQAGPLDVTVSPVVSGGTSAVIVSRRSTCVQGKFVLGPDGSLGYAVPMIGPTVLRGSIDDGPATTLKVVGLDRLEPDVANSITTCFGTP